MIELVHQIDFFLFEFINNDLSNNFFDWILPIFREKKTWIPLYIMLFVFLVYKFKKKSIPIILLALASIGMADGISSHVLKSLVERIRPCNLAELASNIHLRIHCSGGFSFPSSHAANHFSLAMFIGLALYKTNPWFLRIALLWAGIISFAQVYVGVHFPIDVFSGMLLGCGIGVFLNFVLVKFTLSGLYTKFF